MIIRDASPPFGMTGASTFIVLLQKGKGLLSEAYP